jgi:nicotinamide-nucleotide amidase
MSSAALLAIGDELIAGRVREGNFPPLIAALGAHGWRVGAARLCADDAADIVDAIHDLCAHHSLLLTTGGLGPTEDDLTSAAVARALGVERRRDASAEAMIRAFFAAVGRTPSETNLRQADLPLGAVPLRNPCGTAPGFVLPCGSSQIVVLPGVPREVLAIAQTSLQDWLSAHKGASPVRISRTLSVAGLPEASLGEQLRDLMQRGGPVLIGSYPGAGEVRLHLEADASHADALESVAREVESRLGEHVVSRSGASLEAVVVQRLREQGAHLAVAESLTGGLVMARLISIPGASVCCRGGIVAYDDAMKVSLLGVDASLLQREGAVCEAVAVAMAEGLRLRLGTEFALATTGVAGPSADERGNPAGRVFVALATTSGTQARALSIPGSRLDVRERSASAALDLLRRALG